MTHWNEKVDIAESNVVYALNFYVYALRKFPIQKFPSLNNAIIVLSP